MWVIERGCRCWLMQRTPDGVFAGLRSTRCSHVNDVNLAKSLSLWVFSRLDNEGVPCDGFSQPFSPQVPWFWFVISKYLSSYCNTRHCFKCWGCSGEHKFLLPWNWHSKEKKNLGWELGAKGDRSEKYKWHWQHSHEGVKYSLGNIVDDTVIVMCGARRALTWLGTTPSII